VAGKKTLDEGAFRASLEDSLREVMVSDELRSRTLEKCRAWLESVSPAESSASSGFAGIAKSAGNAPADGINEPAGLAKPVASISSVSGRVLGFAGRHAARLRLAAGIAACLIVVVMAGQLLPRMGYDSAAPSSAMLTSREAGTEPSGAGMSPEMFAKSADMPDAVISESTASDEAVLSAGTGDSVTKEAAAETNALESYPAMLDKDSESRSGEGSMAAADSVEAGVTQEAPAAMAAAVPETNDAASSSFLPGTSRLFSSLPVDNLGSALPEKPAQSLAEAAVDAILTAYPGSMPDSARMFAAYLLPSSDTKLKLVSSESIRDLLVPAESAEASQILDSGNAGFIGLWRLPVQTEDGWVLIPLLPSHAVDGIETLIAGEPSVVLRAGDWLETLADRNELKKVLEAAAGYPVSDWSILDIDNGTGFLVGWQDGDNAWCMPFMDQPEKIGLENGRVYDWNALKATVAPYL